jgi:hypothetical protein
MKHTYQTPNTELVLIRPNRMLLGSKEEIQSVQTGNSGTNIHYGGTETGTPVAFSRKKDVWDDDEEEEE